MTPAAAATMKTPWGDPDLQGIWTDETDTPLQRSPKFANQEFFTEAQRAELDRQRAAMPGRERRGARPFMNQRGSVMSVPATPNRMGNRLLDRLPKQEYKSLIRSEKSISLPHGEEVYRQDDPRGLSHVYFPTSGMISLTVLMEDGKEVEAGTIGNEGMIGLSVAHGLDFSPTKAISQISGAGLRIPVSAFLKAMKPGGTLDKLGFIPRMDHRAEYKNAMNILTEKKFTAAHNDE